MRDILTPARTEPQACTSRRGPVFAPRLGIAHALCALAALPLVAASCGGGGDSPDGGAATDDGAAATDAPPPGDAAGSGVSCGGFSGTTCDEGLYCDYADNLCGNQDGGGVCREAPLNCSGEYRPVCGCDGEVYSNACQAYSSGVDIDEGGGCEPPDGTFACGYRFCQLEADYCRLAVSDVVGLPDDYDCITLPGSCRDDPDCACLADEACGDACDEEGAGLTLTCPGG